MNNYIILDKKKKKKFVLKFINKANFKKTLNNKRTTIWENDHMQISIDKLIIRILIYNKNEIEYYNNIFSKEHSL